MSRDVLPIAASAACGGSIARGGRLGHLVLGPMGAPSRPGQPAVAARGQRPPVPERITKESTVSQRFLVAMSALALACAACSSTQYIVSTKSGQLITAYGKPELDTKSGMYTYKDAEGKKVQISKDEVGQIMER